MRTDGSRLKELNGEEFAAAESPIDTEYFGIASAKAVLKKACVSDQPRTQLLDFMQQFEFVTIFNKANDPWNNRWLGEKTKAFLTDVNIQLRKQVSATEEQMGDAVAIADQFPENSRVFELAATSFAISRFLNDPYLPREQARHIYADIVRNAFGKVGRFFATIRAQDAIVGFLLFSIHESESSCTVELIAVGKDHAGQGLGVRLLDSVENYVRKRGARTIQVGTQLNNASALGFYISQGFSFWECSSIYHYWPSKPPASIGLSMDLIPPRGRPKAS